jgi:hypothetical protein
MDGCVIEFTGNAPVSGGDASLKAGCIIIPEIMQVVRVRMVSKRRIVFIALIR